MEYLRAGVAILICFMIDLGSFEQVAAQAGRGCSFFNQCPSGYSCMPLRQKCHRNSGAREGEPCQAGYPCASGFRCEAGSQVCRSLGDVGDPCHATRPCKNGLSCQPGVHKCYNSPRKAGEPCSAGFGCGDGLYCQSFLQKCMPKKVEYTGNSPCRSLRVQATAEDARRIGSTMAFSSGSSGGAGPFISYETGVVYGEDGQFGCFATACAGSVSNISIENFGNIGLVNNFNNFEGFSIVTGQGVDTPFAQFGFQTSQIWSARPPTSANQFLRNQLIGTASGLSYGVGLSPVSLGQALCYTAMLDNNNPLRNFSDIEGILKSWADDGFDPNDRPAKLGGSTNGESHPITATGNPSRQGFGTNGFKVKTVFFLNSSGQRAGYFHHNGNQWDEYNAQGQKRFTFQERNRDEWSVYPRDDSRNVGIQLDLHTRKVNMRIGSNANYRLLYEIYNANE